MNSDVKILTFVRATLNLFKAVPNLTAEKFPSYTLDNERNLANGFFITEKAFSACPCVADSNILKFIKAKFGYNLLELNQGFYKSFRTVTELTPQQILINQILHYMSTYGMENIGIFDKELVYIPNDVLELPADANPVKITVIDAIDNAEIEERANKLILSGVALSKETINDLFAIVKFLDIELKVDDVPNKEFLIKLCEQLNILPKNPVQFLRYMIYIVTGSTLLIKDKNTLYKLRYSEKPNDEDEFSPAIKKKDRDKLTSAFHLKKIRTSKFDYYFEQYIARNGIDKLASIFHRFKPLWIAFKPHSDYLRATINKMRKLADRYHKPVSPRFLERLTSNADVNFAQLKRELTKITTYRKISIANAILYRNAAPKSIVYNIRNGKAFADTYHGGLKFDVQKILNVIIKSIATDIRSNVHGKRIYIPEHFNYAVPVSDKKFIGNIPFGSSYNFASNSIVVGVHWFNVIVKGEEKRIDLDLHLNSRNIDVGWNNHFGGNNFINTKERKIIFSGDMTDARIAWGGATEAFFIGESLTDEVLMANLNLYHGVGKPVPFKLVLADVTQEKIDRQYLLAAHEIAFCMPNKISSREMFLGFITSDEVGAKKFYFFARDMGNRIVARTTAVTKRINSAMYTTFTNCLSLNEVLLHAGAVLEGVTADDCDINLDPAEVTKDTLIGLFAK